MKTPIEILIESIDQMPCRVYTGEEMQDVVIKLLQSVVKQEREHLILAFMEGQATPKASFQLWFDRKYAKIDRDKETEV
jgi:hypothetical protein